jgi:putative intracellular protease/amidase
MIKYFFLFVALAAPVCAAKPARAVLFVVTAADHLKLTDGTTHPTGFYANEFQEPFKAISLAGYKIDVATPGGRVPHVDPRSLDKRYYPEPGEIEKARTWLSQLEQLKHPLDLARVNLSSYDGLFVPGGHGPMEDLIANPDMGRLLREAHTRHLTIGLLCHGPAVLAAAKDASGWPFRGYSVTGFSDAEEPAGLAAKMRTTPERELKALGARYSKATAPYAPHVVSDRGVVTGQNPASASGTAKAFLLALGALQVNRPAY